MRARSISALPAALLLFSCAAGPAAVTLPMAGSVAHQEVKAREREWLDAYERADAGAMSDILADEFLITFPSGRRLDRNDTLIQVRQSRGGTRFWTENARASGERPQVILSGVVVSESGSRQTRQFYTDVWKWNGGRWQVASSILSAASTQ